MKVPLGWLAEWVDLPDPAVESQNDFLERLTIGGLEIEGVERTGPDLSALRVGFVQERVQHPDADRLSVCTVDVGAEEPVDIVCGAPNVAAGQRVAVALHGAVLPDGLKIKRSKIRGVRSNGMICSTRELGLGDEHEGILVLETEAAPGTPLPEVLPAGDTVVDVAITPNRGDWVSMLGMAREVRAHYGGTVRLPSFEVAETGRSSADGLTVEIDDRAGCPRYTARVIRGVEIGPSPDWLRERLESCGVRLVNNVVDITNLVMLEFGQPLHAFDLAQIRGGVIRVRAAESGEVFRTLDEQDRKLLPSDLLIADGEGALALAGVMGGKDSEVSAATTDVLLESAQFHPSRVRKTARRLGLHTDASYRFERGVDPEGLVRAADRAARLMAELAGGEIAPGVVEGRGEALPDPPRIALDPERVNRLLGTGLTRGEVAELLARVDVAVEAGASGPLLCQPPRYRSDLTIPEDLIEEVARVHGYDRIPETLPSGPFLTWTEPARRAVVESLRDALCQAGLAELMTFPAIPESDLDALRLAADDPRRELVRIVNPIQAGEPVLRPTLVSSVLRSVGLNLNRQVEDVRVFEVGRAFLPSKEDELPAEPRQAVAAISRSGAEDLWHGTPVPVFFEAKGVAERVLRELGLAFEFRSGSTEPFLHPGASGAFSVGGQSVAEVGELHPETAAAFDLEAPAAIVVFDGDALARLPRTPGRYRELSRQPRARRDLAVLLGAEVQSGDVIEAIRKTAGSSLRSVSVFDRYEGKGVPKGKVSLAFRLEFQRTDRTLTDAEVGKAVDRVVGTLSERFGGELR